MPLVLGIDSSTQATKALLVDSDDGTPVAAGTAPHPDGTTIDPRRWLEALRGAAGDLLPRASAVAVGAQQHGMVALDGDGTPVCDAQLWNDTKAAPAADELVAEWGGPDACAAAVGSVLVASFTACKLRWLRDAEPAAAARVRHVLLPHDFVSSAILAPGAAFFTDRGDASGTGYFSPKDDCWRPDLAASALGHDVELPRLIAPGAVAGEAVNGCLVAAGTGDNMAAALGLGLQTGDVALSVGTSGVASAVSDSPVVDGRGTVTGFADATGHFLPLVASLNAARILNLQARLLDVDLSTLSDLALSAPPGSNGLVLSPYYGGERTPNRPTASGVWRGLSDRTTRADLSRAAFEALACSLADLLAALETAIGRPAERIFLIGGAAASPALQAILPAVLERSVLLPRAAEYVARGAARQAAWAASGSMSPPEWAPIEQAMATPKFRHDGVRTAYAELRSAVASW